MASISDNPNEVIDTTIGPPLKPGCQSAKVYTASTTKSTENVIHRLRVEWGSKLIDALQMQCNFGSCDQGTPKVTYFYHIRLPLAPIILAWSSCRGECHQPSMQFSSGSASISTRIHGFPCHGQFQEVLGDSNALGKRLRAHLLICYGLTVSGDDQEPEERQLRQQSCLSVLHMSTAPVPRGYGFSGTEYHEILTVETNWILQQIARSDGQLRLLNNIGVFTHVPVNQYNEAGTVPEKWAKSVLLGRLGGLCTALFAPSFASLSCLPGGTISRLYFSDDPKWRIFDPTYTKHQHELEEWNDNPRNSSKVNDWATSITPKILAYTGLTIHSEFSKDLKFPAMIMDFGHTTLQVLLPEAIKSDVDIVEMHGPGPVLGQIDGEDLRCQWHKHPVTGWTKSSSAQWECPTYE